MFEWDEEKNQENIGKHGVSFETAALVFNDPGRMTYFDEGHSQEEDRFHCIGMVDGRVLTVRFVVRRNRIRIIGAGYWRKGKVLYHEKHGLQ